MVLVLVGYDQEQHHSFRDFDDCEELRYLTLLVPLIWNIDYTSFILLDFHHEDSNTLLCFGSCLQW